MHCNPALIIILTQIIKLIKAENKKECKSTIEELQAEVQDRLKTERTGGTINKNIISVIFLFLACLVLISGVTLAYFTDRSEESKIFYNRYSRS